MLHQGALSLKAYREQGIMSGVCDWVEQELKQSLDVVVGLEINQDTREVPSDTQWRSFEVYGPYHVSVRFSDGTATTKDFISLG